MIYIQSYHTIMETLEELEGYFDGRADVDDGIPNQAAKFLVMLQEAKKIIEKERRAEKGSLKGRLEIDTRKGVIWFNTVDGCKLRICGLDGLRFKWKPGQMIDLTLSDLEPSEFGDGRTYAWISYGEAG